MTLKISVFECVREKVREGGEDRRESKRQKNNSRESNRKSLQSAAVGKPAYVSVLFWTHNIECHLFSTNKDMHVNLIWNQKCALMVRLNCFAKPVTSYIPNA